MGPAAGDDTAIYSVPASPVLDGCAPLRLVILRNVRECVDANAVRCVLTY
jgi:hypothetical protein